MKNFVSILLLLSVFGLLGPAAFAEGLFEPSEDNEIIYAVEDALPDEQKELSGPLRLDGQYDVESAFNRLIDHTVEAIHKDLSSELGFGARLLGFALVCSIALALCDESKINTLLEMCACCAVSLMLAGEMNGVIAQASQAVCTLSDFSKASLSAVFLAAAAGGALSSAPVRYAAATLAMDVMISAAERIILPFIRAYSALSICRSLYDNAVLSSVAKAAKWCAVTSMTALTLLFVFYLSITGLIAGSTDAIAVKTAKAVVSNALPIVGGILSDSAGIVLSAASMIKNSVGVFSLIAVCALCIGPFAFLGMKMLVFKGVAAVSDFFPGFRLSALIRDMGTAFGLLLGLVGCCGTILFLSICSGIRTVIT